MCLFPSRWMKSATPLASPFENGRFETIVNLMFCIFIISSHCRPSVFCSHPFMKFHFWCIVSSLGCRMWNAQRQPLTTDSLTDFKPNNSSRIISTEVSAVSWQHHEWTHTRTSHTPWLRRDFAVHTCARHIASQIYTFSHTYCIQRYRDLDSTVHLCVCLLAAASAAACIDINKLFLWFRSLRCVTR